MNKQLFRFTLGLAAVASLSGQSTPAPVQLEETENAATSDRVIVLSPFEVSTARDIGYKAASSISATRIDTPIANLPFAISAFTPEFMSDTNSTSLYDVVKYSVGVTSGARGFNFGSDAFSIRGFPQAPQRDGFYESERGNTYVDTVNLERVEIVKGPASLLYGQVSPGGTVNYITKRPSGKPFAIFNFSAGSYDYARATLDINRPIVPGKLLFRVNASWNNAFQYVDFSESKTTVFAPVVTWNIGSRASLKLSYQRLRREETPPANFLPPVSIATPLSVTRAFNGTLGYPSATAALTNQGGTDFAAGFRNASDPGYLNRWVGLRRSFNQSSLNDYRTTTLNSANAELSLKLTDRWNARAGLGYNKSDNDQFQTGVANSLFVAPPDSLVFSGGAWSVAPAWSALTAAQQTAAYFDFAQRALANPNLAVASQNGTPGPAVLVRRPRLQKAGTENISFQADLTSNYSFKWGTLKPLFGVLYAKVENTDYIQQSNGSTAAPNFRAWDANPASPTYFIQPDTSNALSTAPIINTNSKQDGSDQAVYAALNGSFLDDHLQVIGGIRYNRATSQSTNFVTGGVPSAKAKFSKTTPQIGAGYKIRDGILLYTSYSQSFTIPTQSVLRGIGTDGNGQPQQIFVGQAVPVRGEGYEVGVKTELFDGKFTSTLSLYQITQTDVVQTVNQQIGGANFATDLQGTEVRGRGVEYEFTLSPTKSWQIFGSISKSDIENTKMPAGAQYYLGARPQFSVETMANLWTRYGVTSGKLRGLWCGAGFNYVGDQALDARNRDLFGPAYTLWNASLGYDWKWSGRKLKALVNWQNITDVDYQPSQSTVGLPRRVVCSLTVEF